MCMNKLIVETGADGLAPTPGGGTGRGGGGYVGRGDHPVPEGGRSNTYASKRVPRSKGLRHVLLQGL